MKSRIFLVTVVLLMQLQIQLNSQTPSGGNLPPTKSKADLINDIRTNSDGGNKADDARKIAVQTQQADVIAAGLTAQSYNTRGDCVNSLSAFPVNQQKAALATALSDSTAWNEAHIGEDRACQHVIGQQILDILKNFGINATLTDVLNPTTRQTIVSQLTASQ